MKIVDSPIPAIFALVSGALFIAFKGSIISVLCSLCGLGLFFWCVIDFIYKNSYHATVKLILGILLMVFGWTLTTVILLPVAILTLVLGGAEIYGALAKSASGLLVVRALITVLVGALLVFNHHGRCVWVFVACGILLIIKGVLCLIDFFCERRYL